MNTQDHNNTAAFLNELHGFMDEINEYWLHSVDFSLSQTMPMHGHFTRLKISKNLTDGTIRIEYKPRILTDIQMMSVAGREIRQETHRQRARLVQDVAKAEREEEVARLSRRLQRAKERRERYQKR